MQRGCFCVQRDCLCELWGGGEGFLAMVEDVEVMPEVVEVMPEVVEVMPEVPFLTSQPHFGVLKPHGYWDEASEGKAV